MGSRAQYIVRQDGRWDTYYAHWAGGNLHLDLLAGPEHCTRLARAQEPDDRGLMRSGEPVGAVLIDHDLRRLLWFGDCRDTFQRKLILATVARMWPGWRIEWAYDGMGDLAFAVGLDPAQTKQQRSFELPAELLAHPDFAHELKQSMAMLSEGGYSAPVEISGGRVSAGVPPVDDIDLEAYLARCGDDPGTMPRNTCLLSVARDDTVSAYVTSTSAAAVYENGPAVVERITADFTPRTSWPAFPTSGVHFDSGRKTAAWWTIDTLDQVRDHVDPDLWADWEWAFWADDHSRHLALTGESLVLPVPDPATVVAQLIEDVCKHRQLDSGTEAVALAQRVDGMMTAVLGATADKLVDNSFNHRPMDLPQETFVQILESITTIDFQTHP